MNVFLSISGKINGDILSQMRYGDIIVVFANNKLKWGIIDGCIQEYKLRIFKTTDIVIAPLFNDKLIFSHDAINYRTGNIEAILYLRQVFSCITIRSFLDNLLDILNFKEDRIELGAYAKFFSKVKHYHQLMLYQVEKNSTIPKEEPITNSKPINILPEVKKEEFTNYYPESYLFYDYLDPKCQELWHQCYSYKKYKMRDIFNFIRKTHPHLFTLALKEYNIKNEHGNIYYLKI